MKILFYTLRYYFFGRGFKQAKPNAVRRVKNHFELKTRKQAAIMIITSDPRLEALTDSELDKLNLARRRSSWQRFKDLLRGKK